MFDTVAEAGRRLWRRPCLFATGFAEVLALLGVIGAVTLPAAMLGSLVALLSLWVALLVLPARHLVLFPLGAVAFQQASGVPTRSALRRTRARLSSLFAATAGERALALSAGFLAAVVALPLLLGGATVVRYASLSGHQPFHWTFAAGALAVGLLGVAAGTPFRFAIPLVLGGRRPREALRTSWDASRTAPRQTLVHALVRTVPLLVAVGVMLALAAGGPAWVAVLSGGGVLLVGVTVANAHRTVLFERHVAPRCEASPGDAETGGGRKLIPSVRNAIPPRKVLPLLLALALITAGTGVGRVNETRAVTSPTYPLDGERTTETAFANAERALTQVNHRRVRTAQRWNFSANAWERSSRFTTAIDYRDHQGRVAMAGPKTDRSVRYYGGGTVGFLGYAPDPRRYGPFSYAAGNWTVVAVPGYSQTADTSPGNWRGSLIPGPAAAWQVHERTTDTLVFRINATGLARAWEMEERPTETVESDSWARLTLDPETGYLREATVHRNMTQYASERHERVVDRYRSTVTIRFRYGIDVQRPAPFRQPSPLEVLIDVLEY